MGQRKGYAPRTSADGVGMLRDWLRMLSGRAEALALDTERAWVREEVAGAKLDAYERLIWNWVIAQRTLKWRPSADAKRLLAELVELAGIDPDDWKLERDKRGPQPVQQALPAGAPQPPKGHGRVRPFERPMTELDQAQMGEQVHESHK